MIVASTETVTATIGTTRNTQVVVMTHAGLIIQILPVSIGVITFIERVLVLASILTELRESGTVHHGIFVEHGLETHITIITYLGGSSLGALDCGDDNHTVGTTATVDGGS